jgi:flagellar FliJ protein
MSSRRLLPLLALSQSKIDAVEKKYASKNEQLTQQQSRLGDLDQYAREYRSTPAGKLTASMLKNRLAFADKVDQVIVKQRDYVVTAKQQVEHERQRLLLAKREHEALEKIAKSRRKRELNALERKAQRELDDLALRQHRKNLEEN